MAIRFEANGQVGTLDVTKLAQEELGGTVTGVQDGLVHIKTPDGGVTAFSLHSWAQEFGANIVFIEGFNNPETALETPPNGLNYLDQSVFFNDGMDIGALQELYPQVRELDNGNVVVLDNDGLWKTMWSPSVQVPLPPMSFQEEAEVGLVSDPRLTMRTAGVTFFVALAGIEADKDKKYGGIKISNIIDTLKIINRNAPLENKFAIGKMMNQTTGIDPWKLNNALLAPESVEAWLKKALTLNSFQFRMAQMDLAAFVVDGMRSLAQAEFQKHMHTVFKLEETKELKVNLKQVFAEFIQLLAGLDLLRDISRSTGLQEWINLNEDVGFDKSKLPPMPEFVSAFVALLKWIMPIVEKTSLNMATGKKGFKSIMALMTMIDNCVYSLAGVPDSTAKYKMFMALKKLQTKIESKLAFHYQPDPLKSRTEIEENPFMMAKQQYSVKREIIYKLCQTPKEAWNKTLLDNLRQTQNIEQEYDRLPPAIAKLMKSFAAMDFAYDIQAWVDPNHAERTHDAFSQYNESFGAPPPEAGYIAKNSPRAVYNIAESLIQGAAYLSDTSDGEVKELLRNPWLMSNLFKTLMNGSVNREVETVDLLSKFGIGGDQDMYGSPDPKRIWEDPDVVQKDNQRQLEEMMGQMAMEAASQQEQQAAQQPQQAAPEQAGQGPMGGPMPVRKAG